MTYQSKFLTILEERGFIHQQTDSKALDAYLAECEKSGTPAVAYIGFDCTATSLHVGSLLQIMALKWFQECGHKPIVLLGGGTTKIGDPSGKDESRKMLSDEQIELNKAGIKRNFESYLQFDSKTKNNALLVDNEEWLKDLQFIEMMRLVGPHFSVNRMLQNISVQNRLERDQEMSFLEFNYLIFQSYDFYELYNLQDCRLQMGGSDQWANIIGGIELQRRIHAKENKKPEALFGLTTPLITTASGAKMGKTAAGAVWLDGQQLSPYDYWQFWRNTEDADVGKFLRYFTDLSLEEIAKLEALQGSEINEAKKVLANRATEMLHGADAAKLAAETAQQVFEQGSVGEDLPEFTVTDAQLAEGIPAFKLWQLAGLASSGKEARNLIKGGGARLNDEKVESETQAITQADLNAEGYAKLSAGKKKHAILRAS